MTAPATRLRELLDRLGLSQMAAARLVGVDARSVRRWLAGDRAIPGWAWARLAEEIPPPLPGDGGAGRAAAAEVLAPHVARLVARAVDAGWPEAVARQAIATMARVG